MQVILACNFFLKILTTNYLLGLAIVADSLTRFIKQPGHMPLLTSITILSTHDVHDPHQNGE